MSIRLNTSAVRSLSVRVEGFRVIQASQTTRILVVLAIRNSHNISLWFGNFNLSPSGGERNSCLAFDDRRTTKKTLCRAQYCEAYPKYFEILGPIALVTPSGSLRHN